MVITMTRPKPGLIEMIAMPYNVVWPKKYEGDTNTLREAVDRAGTGPFTVQESVPGEKHVFARKTDYWDQPFPYLDQVEVRILSTQAMVSGMRAGRINLGTFGINGANADLLLRECDLCEPWPRNVNVGISGVIHVNHNRSPWNTPEVKEALSLAYDRARYVQVNTQGWGLLPTCGPFHPGTQWCPAEWEQRVSQLPGYDFSDPASNRERAKEILAQAGYQPGELTVSFRWWQSGNASAPVTIAEDLNAIGITTTLQELQTAVAYDSLTNADFDVQFHGFFVAGTDADVVLYEHFYTGSDRNYGRYANPEFDRMVDEMSQTVDPELRRQRAWDAAEVALKDQAKIIGYYNVYVPIFSKQVRGIMPAPLTLNSYGNNNRHDHTWLTG
jgi:ABC-type transport system substrate-binding protein